MTGTFETISFSTKVRETDFYMGSKPDRQANKTPSKLQEVSCFNWF